MTQDGAGANAGVLTGLGIIFLFHFGMVALGAPLVAAGSAVRGGAVA